MMKKYLLLIALTSITLCDDLYLKSGVVFRNISVTDTTDGYIRIKLVPTSFRTFPLSAVEKLDPVKFDSLYESGFGRWKDLDPIVSAPSQKPSEPVIRKRGAKYEYPNLKLIPVSIISFAFCYDYFSSASNLTETTPPITGVAAIDAAAKDAANKANETISSTKSRYNIIGAMFLAAGIINTVFVFEKIEIKTDGQQLTMAYIF